MGFSMSSSPFRYLLQSPVDLAREMRDQVIGDDDWRLEIKFPLTDMEITSVRSRILNNVAGFRSPYPARTVNNIYFDSVDQLAVQANLGGFGERSKVRLRWYGDPRSIKDPVLEIKIKSRGAGNKLRMSISPTLNLTQHSWHEIRNNFVEHSVPTIRQYLDSARQPMLFNSYSREYYESFDHKVRATIDTNIRSVSQHNTAKPQLEFKAPAKRTIVVELKASVEEHRRLRQVSGSLGWRAGRHSKYTNGVLRSQT